MDLKEYFSESEKDTYVTRDELRDIITTQHNAFEAKLLGVDLALRSLIVNVITGDKKDVTSISNRANNIIKNIEQSKDNLKASEIPDETLSIIFEYPNDVVESLKLVVEAIPTKKAKKEVE